MVFAIPKKLTTLVTVSKTEHFEENPPLPITPRSRRVIFPSLHSPGTHHSSPDLFSPSDKSEETLLTCNMTDNSQPSTIVVPSLPKTSPSKDDAKLHVEDIMSTRQFPDRYNALSCIHRNDSLIQAKASIGEQKDMVCPEKSPRRHLFTEVACPLKPASKLAQHLESTSRRTPKSCLRKGVAGEEVSKVSSIESDIPSLASTTTSSQTSFDSYPRPDKLCFPILSSLQTGALQPTCAVTFNPKIWVREFKRTDDEREVTWYSPRDMETFKLQAMKKILDYTKARNPQEAGTCKRRLFPAMGKAFFSHAALSLRNEEDEPTLCKDLAYRKAVLNNEVHRILLVDPYDICLQLFAKALKGVLPHATIVTARSAAEALKRVEEDEDSPRAFDIVLIEERLKILQRHCGMGVHETSGSVLLAKLKKNMPKTLFIGTSAHLAQEREQLEQSGADVLWPKPPPSMTPALIDDLLRILLVKRGRKWAVKDLFQ